jgi:hypothetical protein
MSDWDRDRLKEATDSWGQPGDHRSVEEAERADAIKADSRRVRAEGAAVASKRHSPSPDVAASRKRRKRSKPPLVNQPTNAPVRKLKYGGIAAVLAIVIVAVANRVFGINLPPELASLVSSEILMALGAAVVWVVGYLVKARERDC